MTSGELVQRTFDRLAEIYPKGLYEFMEEHLPELSRQLHELEERIDRCLLNGSGTDDLKPALREYWMVHVKAIEEWEREGLQLL
jgi:hypothetical protein